MRFYANSRSFFLLLQKIDFSFRFWVKNRFPVQKKKFGKRHKIQHMLQLWNALEKWPVDRQRSNGNPATAHAAPATITHGGAAAPNQSSYAIAKSYS